MLLIDKHEKNQAHLTAVPKPLPRHAGPDMRPAIFSSYYNFRLGSCESSSPGRAQPPLDSDWQLQAGSR